MSVVGREENDNQTETMRKTHSNAIPGISTLSLAVLLSAGASAAVMNVWQGGIYQGTFESYSGGLTAAGNFGYSSSSAHLTAGPPLTPGKAHLFFYDGSDGLHFNVVFSAIPSGGAGSANWSISLSGNGATDGVVISDDSGELGVGYTGNWTWDNTHTDGGVIGPIGGSAWSLTITPTGQSLPGGMAVHGGSGVVIPLSTDVGQAAPFSIVIEPSQIPEPWQTASLSAVLLLGLAGWRRMRARR